MAKSKEEILEKAFSDINNDRAIVSDLLTRLHIILAQESAKHKDYGLVMAKYLERATSINSQYLEIIEIMRKTNKNELNDLTKHDKEDLLDEIQKEK
jgi:thiamine kinase-like enzyme